MVADLITNLAVHSQESNLQPVDHKSDALTTAPPSQDIVCSVSVLDAEI